MAPRKGDETTKRFLSLWERPQEAGDPIACIATTFTFDPIFFEEHCLSRFLGLETDPHEDVAQYLIEREERLAVTKVCVVVDRANADGSASARWDVVPVAVPHRSMHAKISVLVWSGLVRLLIGSANLTEPGYRKNQEVIGVLDFREAGGAPRESLQQVLGFLDQLIGFATGSDNGPGPKTRLRALLRAIAELTHRWKPAAATRRDWPRVTPILLAPFEGFQSSIPHRLGQMIRDQGGPSSCASVVSPFFDQAAAEIYRPNEALLVAMTDRGERTVEFLVPGELLPDGRLRLRAPRSLSRHGRKAASIAIYPVIEDVDSELRPLHAKSLWLWNDRGHVYMIGSSNFTSAGLGLTGAAPNVEANLAYVFPEESALVAAMEETLPAWGDAVENPDDVIWEPIDEAEGEDPGDNPVLPNGFEEALFDPGDGGGTLRLRFGSKMPSSWTIRRLRDQMTIYSADTWHQSDDSKNVELPWQEQTVPTALQVRWVDEAQRWLTAAWPVGITDPSKLPPPEELRNLSLETLVDILCSRLPLHEALARLKSRIPQANADTSEAAPDTDPLRRVNTETFLLQRTRRVATALAQLVENLNRPAAHLDAFVWRLRGPVGPLALAKALERGAHSPGEASFLLSEIILALGRVDVAKVAVGISQAEVRKELQQIKNDVDQMARASLSPTVAPAIAAYVLPILDGFCA